MNFLKDEMMTLKGKVVNLLPYHKPLRAVITLDEWPNSIEIPIGSLKVGMHVEVEVRPIQVRAAGVRQGPVLPVSLLK